MGLSMQKLVMLCASAALVSCVNSANKNSPAPGQRQTSAPQSPPAQRAPIETELEGISGADATTMDLKVPVSLPDDLMSVEDGVSPRGLWTFTFSFNGEQKNGPVQVTNGRATISIPRVPINVRSNMTLRLLEDGVAKLEGTQENVTVTATQNRVRLQMRYVNAPTPSRPPQGSTPSVSPSPQPQQPTPPQPSMGPIPGIQDGDPRLDLYMSDIKPIFDAHCVECHDSGRSLNLLSYPFPGRPGRETVQKILNFVVEGAPMRMPMGNRPPLSPEQISKINNWLISQ